MKVPGPEETWQMGEAKGACVEQEWTSESGRTGHPMDNAVLAGCREAWIFSQDGERPPKAFSMSQPDLSVFVLCTKVGCTSTSTIVN